MQKYKDKIQLIAFNSLRTGGGISTYLKSLRKNINLNTEILTFSVRKQDKNKDYFYDYEFCLQAKKIFSEAYYIPVGNLIKLIKIIKKRKVFHFNPHTFSEVILLVIIRIFNKKAVITFHSNFIKGGKLSLEKIRQFFVYNFSAVLANKIVFLTKSQLKNVKRITPFKSIIKKKSVIINNFISEEYILNKKKSISDIKIIFVGRYSYAKGFNIITELASRKMLNKVEFNLVGRRHSDKNLPNLKNVNYIDSVKQEKIFDYYDRNNIFLLPSYSEVFPLTVLEAMSRGLVILLSDISGMKEIIEEKRNGFFFYPGNVDRLEELILFLKNNPQEIKRISENNIKDVEKFTAKNLSPHYFDLYKELLIN